MRSAAIDHVLVNAKAYVALVGSLCVALLAVLGPNEQLFDVLSLIAALCTAFVTWRVPNKPSSS